MVTIKTVRFFQILQNIYKILLILICSFIIINTVKISNSLAEGKTAAKLRRLS